MLCIRNIIISERTNKNANLKKNVTLLLVDIEIESYSFLCTLPVHSCGIKLTSWMPTACNWYFNSIYLRFNWWLCHFFTHSTLVNSVINNKSHHLDYFIALFTLRSNYGKFSKENVIIWPISGNGHSFTKNERRNKTQRRRNLLASSNKNVCNRTSISEDNRRRHNSPHKIILATLWLDGPVKFCDGNPEPVLWKIDRASASRSIVMLF